MPDDGADHRGRRDRPREREPGRERERDRERGEENRRRSPEDDDSGGFSFTLPPIRLPPMGLPDGLRLALPAPKRAREFDPSPRSVLAAAVLFDLLDAALVVAGVGPVLGWTRVVAGLALAALVTGVYATLYAWEAAALAAGLGRTTVVPSLSLLVLYRARRRRGGPGI